MNKRIVFHYLLFLIIIFGAFASMAQNNYGLTLISAACILFAISLLLELVQEVKSFSLSKIVELIGLTTLFVLFALRAAYIHFFYIEWLLIFTCSLLIIIYVSYVIVHIKKTEVNNKRIRNLILAYYISLIGFTLSILVSMIVPELAEPLGALATGFLGILLLGVYLNKTQIVAGTEVKTTDYLRKQAGQSILLMTGYWLISLYSGLHMVGILPSLYTNTLPQAYIELIYNAESGNETAVDGVYQHELYKEAYDKFVAEHGEVE